MSSREPSSDRSLLLRHNLFFDLVVGHLREKLVPAELILSLVQPPLDDLLGIGVIDAGSRLELVWEVPY